MKTYLLLFCLFCFGCQSDPSSESEPIPEGDIVLFQNVNVVTMEGEVPLLDHSVMVVDDKIYQITNDVGEIPEGTQVIDAKGKYLVPGLAEMHAHIPTPDQGEALIKETLLLYLAGGVTTIRGMLGHPRHLELRDQVEDGTILGPRIYTSGPSINGNTAPDIETVTGMVRDQSQAGYDFLKLHPGIKLEVFDALVETANEVGISFAGHVSRDVGVRHAIKSGYASIDHLDGYVEGLVPPEENVDPQQNGFFGINFTDLADKSLLPELIKQTAEHSVWIVPTQCLAERWAAPVPTAELMSDAEIVYMSPETRDNWKQSKENMMGNSAYDKGKAQRWIDLRRLIIKEMYDNEVGVLLGSDAPQVFNVPGFAIQHEIEMYVAAGLSPYEALVTGTVNPAVYFGTQDQIGKIKEGHYADLVLVEANPLDDISNLADKAGVMIRGKWLSREFLDEQLQKIEAKYSN